MKTSSIILALMLLAVPTLRAQIVADGATNTLSNVTNNGPSTVTVGTNGAFTLLVLSNNALLNNNLIGVIGRNASARSNEVRLVSATARWNFAGFGELYVGSNGASSRLTVSGGGSVSDYSGNIGQRASSTNNAVLVTDPGSQWSVTFLTLGNEGAFNQLTVSNGARVQNSLGGAVGVFATSSNNQVTVTGAGSFWTNQSYMFLGSGSVENRTTVSAGGLLACRDGYVGLGATANRNTVLVTDSGSAWTNLVNLSVGDSGSGNQLIASNGAIVHVGGNAVIGFNSTASSNSASVIDPGTMWTVVSNLYVGSNAPRNRFTVSNGGRVTSRDVFMGFTASSGSNVVTVTGSGSVWSNAPNESFYVGYSGSDNQLVVSNGGAMHSSIGSVGQLSGSSRNEAVVTGAGSTLNTFSFVVGYSGASNRLQVDNGATVFSGNLFIGFNSGSANNRITVNGGTLRVTNAAGTGVLDVRRGTNLLQSGLVDVDHLVVTNNSGFFEFNGGTLMARKATQDNQTSFRVGNGVSPATFILAGNGPYSFDKGLDIRVNAMLIGDATITGSLLTKTGSTLAPGGPQGGIGRLITTDSAALAGTTIMEISRNGAVLTNDQVVIGGTLTYDFNATVIVTNIGSTALTTGDRFQLFLAGTYAGLLPAVSLPPLGSGFTWTNKLLVDGSIKVIGVSVQTLPASALTQTSATLNGVVNPNGSTTTAYFQWGTTTNYGNVTATTNAGSGTNDVAVAIGITGLSPVTTYHFRMVGSNSFGLGFGADQSFTNLSTNADLASLTSTAGILTPAFSSGVTSYTVFVDSTVTSATVTPTAAEAGATIQVRVNGGSFGPVASGNASSPLAFNAGNNLIEVLVAAPDPAFTKTYALTIARLGQAGHLIYTDQLANGFQQLGAMTVNLANTAPVHSGSKSISATITSGNQDLYFVRSDMDSALYSSVSFWINGGPSGGQQLVVYGIVGFVWQSSYALGPLPPNTWQHFTIPLALLGAAHKTNFNGIVFQDSSLTAQPTFYLDDIQLDGVPPPALVNVSVSATQIVRTVDARLFGVNAAAWDGDLDSPSTISVLTDMDNQVLRWPGGSWGDIYHESAPPNVGWGSYTSNFIHVATNTRAQVFMIANYGTGTPQEAADWVRYCNVTNQAGFKYWEIGNEVFGSWEEDHNTNAPFVAHDPWTYAMRFKDYYTQMKAVDPTIKIGAVAEVGEDNWANNTNHPALNPRTGLIHNGWVPVMLTTLKTNGVTPDFLIHHKYAPTGSDANNLLWSSTWASDAASMRQMLTDYLGDAGTNTELVCTEHGPGGNKQKTSLVGGLFWADSLGQILQTEFNARVWWDLRNGQSAITPNPLLYGWRNYYDEGIVVGQAEPANRYPTFYCGKLMKYFARGGDQVVTASSDFPLLATYAVRRTDGSLTLLVINKSPYDTLTGGFSLAGYAPLLNATVYSYGIPQDEAARTNAPAAQMDIATTNFIALANFTYAFPPYSVTVFEFVPPAIQLTGMTVSANGAFQFSFANAPGATSTVLTTTNVSLSMSNWTVLGAATEISSGQYQFTDPQATNSPQRFYRVRWP